MSIVVLFRAVCLTAIAVAVCGCVRTYDGSIMPTYETTVVHAGPIPLLGFRRTQVAPGNAGYEFPSAPRRPVYAPVSRTAPARVSRVRNRSRAATTTQREAAPTVRCRDAVTEGGRIKVVCE